MNESLRKKMEELAINHIKINIGIALHKNEYGELINATEMEYHLFSLFKAGFTAAVNEVIRMLKNPLTHGELCQWLNDGFVNPSPERVANWLEQQLKKGDV